ncbi:hypothetical protein CK620_07470 [Vandammella animalimorsus]|uniref:Uncharacterized protein n=1 Tax=Vandammella animalimorsus TaxID=2029117 RepID=A0A2A2AA82_9BURK|nr:hypothetical protein CK620_07470 [Vandammella animalimorsus]
MAVHWLGDLIKGAWAGAVLALGLVNMGNPIKQLCWGLLRLVPLRAVPSRVLWLLMFFLVLSCCVMP